FCIYVPLFSLTHNGTIMVVPIVLSAWFFCYRGLLLCLGSLLVTTGVVSLILARSFWPYSFALIYVTGIASGLVVGLVVSFLRHVVDMLSAAHLKTELAEQAYKQQQQLNQLKDQLILHINHELRNPLTAVRGYLEVLSMFGARIDGTQQALYLDHALNGCDELLLMINHALDAAQVSSGIKPPCLQELSVALIVRDVLALLDPRMTRGYHLQVEVPEELTVCADAQYLRQVLRNLLSNAFKYSPAGTSVCISAILSPDPPEQVCICVKDAGPGIPEDELSLLFQRFVRLQRDLSGPIGGIGLGLYISKQLVEAMKGHIWAESSGRAGEGSRFCFTLPAASVASLQVTSANEVQ
ncbi:MAG: HAMP domain-containing histidine kinase, partial [Chloroflexi bacterium]|nr:HAMP domain-containing histidine kinase [Chloroflexota bacterium]